MPDHVDAFASGGIPACTPEAEASLVQVLCNNESVTYLLHQSL